MADSQEPQSKTCTICDKVFSRAEHLKRHVAIHKHEKPFGCKHCEKTFSRKDAARRHEQSHLPGTTLSRGTRASFCQTCSSCTKARVKCSGTVPCSFCSARALDCAYLPRKRWRRDQSPTRNRDLSTKAAQQPLTTTTTSDAEIQITCEVTSSPGSPHQSRSFGLDHTVDMPSNKNADRHAILDVNNDAGNVRSQSPASSMQYQHAVSGSPYNASMNWLPFRASTFGGAPFILQTQQALQDLPGTFDTSHSPQTISGDTQPRDHSTLQRSVSAQELQNDQISALIESMLTSPTGYGPESPSSPSNRSQIGQLYADGHGARVSQSDRRANCRASVPVSGDTQFALSNSAKMSALREKANVWASKRPRAFRISSEVHAELIGKISAFVNRSVYSVYDLNETTELSAPIVWSYLTQLYFDHFHPIHPFLDQSLLGLPTWGWALCLAAASMGARFTAVAEAVAYGEFLSRMLHKVLVIELEAGELDDALPFLQARAICAINLFQSRQHELVDVGVNILTWVSNSSLRLKLFSESRRAGEVQQGQTAEQAWIAWRFREMRRRTGIFVCTTVLNMAFVQGTMPSLNMNDLSLLLPSSEELWQAETFQQWFARFVGSEDSVLNPELFRTEENSRKLLRDTVRDLWLSNQLQQSMSPSTTEIVILMLIKRVWSADQYLGDQLYARSRDDDSHFRPPGTTIIAYPGSDPSFSKWRNTICDCLDTIHWDALSASARACGFESTVFLSLHLARLLLLTPIKELLGFVHDCAGANSAWALPHCAYSKNPLKAECRAVIRTWWFQDRYKARLALIHAGAMFWHVRRYASNSYMQPFAVYLATIVLWAYATCANCYLSQTTTSTIQGHSQHHDVPLNPTLGAEAFRQHTVGHTPPIYSEGRGCDNQVQGDRLMPDQAQLDRPIDDELVQYFIRHGSLRLSLEGVPDLCSAEGSLQILQQGASILELSTSAWPISERYIFGLRSLASVVNSI